MVIRYAPQSTQSYVSVYWQTLVKSMEGSVIASVLE
jgi:hypothetical protein